MADELTWTPIERLSSDPTTSPRWAYGLVVHRNTGATRHIHSKAIAVRERSGEWSWAACAAPNEMWNAETITGRSASLAEAQRAAQSALVVSATSMRIR